MNDFSPRDIEAAAQVLRVGGLVAFPTETVYGLGADAGNPEAVLRIFAAKGRPADHPLIVHFAWLDDLDYWAREVPNAARRLAERFWPGPLTLILKRRHAPLEVTGGQDTVGLRMPAHPVALALLDAFGGGVAAPSANRFGRVSPTAAHHVRNELMGKVDMILDGGPCQVGVESTIISLAGERPRLLRPGAIPLSALQEALGEEVDPAATRPAASVAALAEARPASDPVPSSVEDIRAPGMLASHYAPETPLEVWPLAALKRRGDELARSGGKAAALLIDGERYVIPDNPSVFPVPMPADPTDYARRLYAVLRMLDGTGFDLLLAEAPPDTEDWHAVNDRLLRARSNRDTAGPILGMNARVQTVS
jgi:L-threonylcarbamoyladenylate synthase